MIQIKFDELSELRESVVALEKVLETLDRIGAGIAAIHVDAAIDQLRNNLEVADAQGSHGSPGLLQGNSLGHHCEGLNPQI